MYVSLSKSYLSQKYLEFVQKSLAAELKAFIALDLSAEERQGHQSLEDVGSPNIDSLMGGAFEPYRNSLCVQHYHSHAVLVRVRLSKNST